MPTWWMCRACVPGVKPKSCSEIFTPSGSWDRAAVPTFFPSAMEYRPAGVDLLVASICWPCAKLAVTTIEQLTGKDGK